MSVSVIMPCYRNAGSVGRAVRSVMAQTEPALELIAVDDASGDGTVPELRSLQAEYGPERMRLIELAENRGPSAARNAGWREARGEWVAFLDADDAWHPRKLEIQMGFLRAHPHFRFSGHLWTSGEPTGEALPAGPEARFTEIRFHALLYRNWFHTSSVVLRRDLPQRFDESKRYGEDRQLWIDVAAAGHRIARLDLRLLTVYKEMYGASGLSAHLWAMEAAELQTFRHLYRAGRISAPVAAVVLGWSLARYLRRRIVVALR